MKCLEISYDGDLEAKTITTVEAPEFEMSDLDVNWKSLSNDLVYEILSLQNLKNEIEIRGNTLWEYQGAMDYIDERQTEYAKLGVKAIELSEKLRNEIGLGKVEKSNIGFEWKENLKDRKSHLVGSYGKRNAP